MKATQRLHDLIPVAAEVLYPFFGLLLSPIIVGAAMSLSCVTVISKALRLRNVKLLKSVAVVLAGIALFCRGRRYRRQRWNTTSPLPGSR